MLLAAVVDLDMLLLDLVEKVVAGQEDLLRQVQLTV
jgi:hypothetical protein